MLSIEEAHQKVMASWRGRVDEETMVADLKALELAVLEEMFPSLPQGSQRDSVLLSLISVKKHIRKRIEALGG